MRHRLLVPVLLSSAALFLPGLAACEQGSSTPDPTTSAAEDSAASASAQTEAAGEGNTSESGEAASAKAAEKALKGKVVAIDPGHNGGNAAHPEKINKPVSDGRGGTKACNTTGTATTSDYPEADFTWAVAEKLRKSLTDAGAEVVLSRKDNEGVGPCVDERGTFADDADLLVSIHANGSESSSVKGFHIIVADPGEDAKTEKASVDLAKSLGSSLDDDFTPNKAYGKDAISRRPDLAGLNNASVPAVIVECGEMRNAEEAKLMESKAGQQKYADALFAGIVDWF